MNEKNSIMSSRTNSGIIINSSGGVGGKGKLRKEKTKDLIKFMITYNIIIYEKYLICFIGC
jgi:hypothetical protein